jgi:hypothetical protein
VSIAIITHITPEVKEVIPTGMTRSGIAAMKGASPVVTLCTATALYSSSPMI